MYVYNDNGDQGDHLAMSRKMAEYLPKNKPIRVDLKSLKKIKMPNQEKPPHSGIQPNPVIPPPKPYNPVPRFKEFIAKVSKAPDAKGKAHITENATYKDQKYQVFKNLSTQASKAKKTYTVSIKKSDWASVKHYHVKDFDKDSIESYEDPADDTRSLVSFTLLPGQEFGWILPPKAEWATLVSK